MPVGGEKYVLREASEATATEYRCFVMRLSRLTEAGREPKAGEDFPDAEPLLVSRCLFRLNHETGQEVPVGEAGVKKLPARVVKRMFRWVQDNSDLLPDLAEAAAGGPAKNAPEAGPNSTPDT